MQFAFTNATTKAATAVMSIPRQHKIAMELEKELKDFYATRDPSKSDADIAALLKEASLLAV